ncbi:L-rhamnonate dehydratase [Hypericibacter terrae]|jgi:L-alanine-DL-glutamate epimerase-like enolase superfamily enzyme|uniref:L-rhamnonate dehydratase n=1 Tax=Hypericibacter terrae TaxID=2602015 RepID=A0A5J6MFQ5_9PROT|nr:L-rhamnonate dehydratase [Hypericibacter terrae]QEX16334.1 L-rhamnonate dehydratase [Hypericibacter terrae]
MTKRRIADIRAFVIDQAGTGGDYSHRESGHWLVDDLVANPMSVYPEYRVSRNSWGMGVLGSILVEVETDDGQVGVATGLGGDAACFLIERHFRRFVVGSDPHDLNRIWDQMYRASSVYGRKGLPVAALSVVDLALWDLLGKIRGEPVYRMIGGKTRDHLNVYATGPSPDVYRELGFIGTKVPLPHGPADGLAGLRANRDFIADARRKAGPDHLLMVDCYLSLDVPYAIALAEILQPFDVNWIEEPLQADDWQGFKLLKAAHPKMKWTTGEHEYTRYGFRQLIDGRHIDILQPDVMWAGGLTELLRICAMAAAYDIPVVPHCSGPYSNHLVISQPNCPFSEFLITSPKGDEIRPLFGDLFEGEVLPQRGSIGVSEAPGWGLTVRRDAVELRRPYDS